LLAVHEVGHVHYIVRGRGVVVRKYLIVDETNPKGVWDDDYDSSGDFARTGLRNIGPKAINSVPSSSWSPRINVTREALRA
jgi:hypothetical protein